MDNKNVMIDFYLHLLQTLSEYTQTESGPKVIMSKSCRINSLSYFFKKKFKLPDSELLLKEYNDIKKSLYSSQYQNIWDWLDNLYNFGFFIRVAEKCSMYINDEDNRIYCEISDSQILNIYFKLENYKVKISFEKTSIPKVPKSVTNNFLDKYINGTTSNESIGNLFFVTIEVVRTYGKQMCNIFKFVSNESPQFNDITDKFVFSKIKSDISKSILSHFNYIINTAVKELQYVYINWYEALSKGFIVYDNDTDKIIKKIKAINYENV